MNQKGVGIVYTIFATLAGIIAFMVWIQVYVPVTNDILFVMLDNAELNIAHAVWIKALVQLVPLVLAAFLLMSPMLMSDQSTPYYPR